jgi:HK97 family phage major capsid protein
MSELSILEMRDKRALLLDEAKQLLETAKTEVRKLTDDEQADFDAKTNEVKELSNQIKLKDVDTRNDVDVTKQIKSNKMSEFKLLNAIKAKVENRQLDEATMQVIEAGKSEMRKSGINPEGTIVLPSEYRAIVNVTGNATEGKEIVGVEQTNILEPLREALVLTKAGATFLPGLVGDVSIPSYGGTSALWKGETVVAVDGAGAFAEVELQPKRLTAFIDVSKQFLNQDSVGAEEMLKRDIVNAVAAKLENTIFGKAAGSATQPAGFFAVAPSIAGAATWDNVVGMETAVDTSNALVGNLSYITNAGGRGILKSTDKGTDTGKYLLEGSEMNGYPVHVTNHVAKALQLGADEYGVVFGNWGDYVVGQWGGIDLVVDPYTVATEGKVRLVINAYFDAKPRRAASFKTGSIK